MENREHLCPCGSGLAHAMCCLKKAPAGGSAPGTPNADDARLVEDLVRRQQAQFTRFGAVRPFVHASWRGKKWVAVGGTLYSSPGWKTPLDFLKAHIIEVFGREWGSVERARLPESRHPVMQWFLRMCDFQAKQVAGPDGLYRFAPNGPTAAYLCLAYDLYIVRHHQSLLDSLVKRLRHRDQFQGARYELFVAATCIRAGFSLLHEDESDSTRRHPEFLATHSGSGQRLWVEAKSKHRIGILGRDGEPEAEPRARVRYLLRDAAAKRPDGPLVLFVDVNLPPTKKVTLDTAWCREALDEFCNLEGGTGDSTEPINLAVFTNHPHHYGADDAPAEGSTSVSVFARKPRFPVIDMSALLRLEEAVQLYGNIPHSFEELQ